MTESHWQLQEAKQRFSEVVREAQAHGAQFVTKHGAEVAVVLDIAEYTRLQGTSVDFKEFLRRGPHTEDLDFAPRDLPRLVDPVDPR